MRSAKLERRSLCDQVYDVLLGDIIGGRYSAGSRLSLDDVASEFGVSRTPVREAVMRLSEERFLDVAHNSRTMVAGWGEENMRDRVVLLGGLSRAALQRLDAPALMELGGAFDGSVYKGFATFVHTNERLLERGFSLGSSFARGLSAPLLVFLQQGTLAGRGLTAAIESRPDLHWGRVSAALSSGDAAAALPAYDTYTRGLGDVLSRPVAVR